MSDGGRGDVQPLATVRASRELDQVPCTIIILGDQATVDLRVADTRPTGGWVSNRTTTTVVTVVWVLVFLSGKGSDRLGQRFGWGLRSKLIRGVDIGRR